MGKIQKVVEKAKERHEREIKAVRDSTANASAHLEQPPAQDLQRISTSSLPVVDIDADILTRQRILTHDGAPNHPMQGAYRMLRTRVMQSMRTNNWRVLGVSSMRENEGKTFTAINLAFSIAAEYGQEAILVDLDLRKPSIHRTFGMESGDIHGLKDYLTNKNQDLVNLCFNPGIDRLGVLLSAEPLERSSDLLASPRGTQLFAELRGRMPEGSIIIVDLPPILAADDALAVAPLLDALLLVVAEGQAERDTLAEAREIFESFNVIGTVLNKSMDKDSKRSSYY